jgi:hypothetical protein
MFAKLKHSLDIQQYTEKEILISFGETVDDKFQGIEYRKVVSKHAFDIFNTIPTKYRGLFDISLMKINRAIPAHTDSEITCAINFYVKTSNCMTMFYSLKNNNPNKIQIENQTNGCIFNEEDLIWNHDCFIAEPGEAWVLDVTKPHSVMPIDPGNPERIAITLATRSFTFDEVCAILASTGSL